MPRTVDEILEHAVELAERFESYEPHREDLRDPEAVLDLRDAVAQRARAEAAVRDAVAAARETGYSWSAIGLILGTSGEAARQRYGVPKRA